MKLKDACSWKTSYDKPRQHIRKAETSLDQQSLYCQSYCFSGSHVQMWQLVHKEGWVVKNWCFQIVVLEKTLESPLDSKEIKLVNPKGKQSWIFTGKTEAEAEVPVFWILIQEQTNWTRPWCWKRLKVKKEVVSRGWDGWMVSLTQWTGIWATLGDSEG